MNKNNFFFLIAIVATIIAGAYLLLVDSSNKTASSQEAQKTIKLTPTPNMEKNMPKPEMQLDTKKKYSAVLHTTIGDITIDFDTQNTPITSNNFIYLAKNHFYDDTIFHRVMEDFMIQGGDPTGTGSGGPGYRFDDEYLKGSYTKGTVAMANAGANTNGSQFFIVQGSDVQLDNDYVIFAHVTKGIDVVDKIAAQETTNQPGTGEKSKPVDPIKITSIDIVEQ